MRFVCSANENDARLTAQDVSPYGEMMFLPRKNDVFRFRSTENAARFDYIN